MHSSILKYCKSIRKRHIEVLRHSKKGWYWDLPACASICHDGNNGRQKRGYSHKPDSIKWNHVLRRKMTRKLGQIGTKSKLGKHYIIGNCAEQHSGNNYMKRYGVNNLSSLSFSETVRPRTMEIIPPCDDCKAIFPNL